MTYTSVTNLAGNTWRIGHVYEFWTGSLRLESIEHEDGTFCLTFSEVGKPGKLSKLPINQKNVKEATI